MITNPEKIIANIEILLDEYKQAKLDINTCMDDWSYSNLVRKIESLKHIFLMIGVWEYVK
jgi:hypothetical protein